MKVFLSWSGNRSHKLAEALRDWLPGVLQSVEPWLSSQDIRPGERWEQQLQAALRDVDVGLLCLTHDNLKSPWLMMEAGALWQRARSSSVIPYLLDIAPSDLPPPLSSLQSVQANRLETLRLVELLNSKNAKASIRAERVREAFDVWWPRLQTQLEALHAKGVEPAAPEQTLDNKIDEILKILRESASLAIGSTSMGPQIPPSTARPRIFIGSSSEGLQIAEAVQLGLDDVAECTIWNQSAFALGATPIESLVDIGPSFTAAVLILTPDDMIQKRGQSGPTPRDNLIFEAGFFTGILGRARTFLVHPREPKMILPSDLVGVTAATYASRSDGNLHAAVGVVCTRIKRALGLA